METSDTKKAAIAKKSSAASLRVRPETRKALLAELAKVNKKSYGRKVRVEQLLRLLLTLIKPEHIQKLQSESLSNSDRIEMKFREHVKKFGAVSKDEFLGLLIQSDAAKTSSENAAVSEGKMDA